MGGGGALWRELCPCQRSDVNFNRYPCSLSITVLDKYFILYNDRICIILLQTCCLKYFGFLPVKYISNLK